MREIHSHHALRGLAALLVVFYHVRDIAQDGGAGLDRLTHFFATGYLWVDFFFVLSGFVLCHVYLDAFGARSPLQRWSATIAAFLRARLARIYPLHLATLLGVLAIELSALVLRPEAADVFETPRKSVGTLFASVFLLHAWNPAIRPSWNVPSWSISTEFFAYLCFPAIALVASAWRSWGAVAIGAFAFVSFSWLLADGSSVEDGIPLLRCLAGFTLGVFVHRVWAACPVLSAGALSLLQVAGFGGLLCAMHYDLSHPVAIVCFAIIVLATADDRGAVVTLLVNRPLRLLGTLSYSIYLVHWLVYRVYLLYGGAVFGPLASDYAAWKVTALKYAVVLGASFALGALSYYQLEVPARRWLRGAQRPPPESQRSRPA